MALWWSFRRICWVGPWPPRLPEGPVIAYTNHHSYYDGHFAWLLFRHALARPTTLWMAEWDRFPFFGALGAQPFPPESPRRRAATLRRTARRFRANPTTVLVYFPGGELRPPDDGIAPFDADTPRRLARLYPEATWWPYATHVTWQGDAAPVVRLRGGPPHDADGRERERLLRQWRALQDGDSFRGHTLARGVPGGAEQWDFSSAAPFFERYL